MRLFFLFSCRLLLEARKLLLLTCESMFSSFIFASVILFLFFRFRTHPLYSSLPSARLTATCLSRPKNKFDPEKNRERERKISRSNKDHEKTGNEKNQRKRDMPLHEYWPRPKPKAKLASRNLQIPRRKMVKRHKAWPASQTFSYSFPEYELAVDACIP